MKVTVIIVHHAGRSGLMRGTSKREDSAAWIIKVEQIGGQDDLADQEDARFSNALAYYPSQNSVIHNAAPKLRQNRFKHSPTAG